MSQKQISIRAINTTWTLMTALIAVMVYGHNDSSNSTFQDNVDVLSYISGFCKPRTLSAVCRTGIRADNYCELIDSIWVTRTFGQLLNYNPYFMQSLIWKLLDAPTLCNVVHSPLECVAIEVPNEQHLDQTQPSMWKGVLSESGYPFIVFVLTPPEFTYHQCAQCHKIHKIREILVMAAILNGRNTQNVTIFGKLMDVTFRRPLTLNACIGCSNSNGLSFKSTSNVTKIQNLMINGKIEVDGDIWTLEKEWTTLNEFIRFRRRDIFFKKMTLPCAIWMSVAGGVAIGVQHGWQYGMILALIYIAQAVLMFGDLLLI